MHPHQPGVFPAPPSAGECSSGINDEPAGVQGSVDCSAPSAQSMGSRTSSVSGGDDDQQFCLRWHNFQTNLSTGFDSLLRNETFVDVTLACSTSYPGAPIPAIKCHKVVLAACSPYFEALLRGTPCQHPVIVLKDVRYEDLKPLVEFMYKGQVNVLQEQIPTLINLAEAFRIRGLAEVDQNNRVTMDPDRSRASSVTENGDGGNTGRDSAHSLVKEEYIEGNFRGFKRPRMEESFIGRDRQFGPGFGTSMSCIPTGGRQGSGGSSVGMIPLYQEPFERGFGGGEQGNRGQFPSRQPGDGNCPAGSSSSHEIKPAIAEMILEEERARRMEAENYGMWRKPWPPGPSPYGNSNFRMRERGPVKTWTAETMAAALRAVLQNNLSLSRSARMFEIPYPTFVLYANKLHNLLGPSAGGGEENVRPKGRGRPQRILLGNWPSELVEGAIRSVVFREPPENFHHLSAQWNSNFLAQNANAAYSGNRPDGQGNNSGPSSVAGGPASVGQEPPSPKPDDTPGPPPQIMPNPSCDQSQSQRQQNANLNSEQDQPLMDSVLSPGGQPMMDGRDGNNVASPASAMPVMQNSQPSPGYQQMQAMKMESSHHSAVFPGMEHASPYAQDARVAQHHEAPVYMGHPAMHPGQQDQVTMSAPPPQDMMANCLNL